MPSGVDAAKATMKIEPRLLRKHIIASDMIGSVDSILQAELKNIPRTTGGLSDTSSPWNLCSMLLTFLLESTPLVC